MFQVFNDINNTIEQRWKNYLEKKRSSKRKLANLFEQ